MKYTLQDNGTADVHFRAETVYVPMEKVLISLNTIEEKDQDIEDLNIEICELRNRLHQMLALNKLTEVK